MGWVVRRDAPRPADAARLLAALPDWFGLPDANADYLAATHRMDNWTVRDAAGRVIGLALVDPQPDAAEIHLMAVEPALHGHGVGTAMVEAIASDARARGVRLLRAKTLGPSDPDPAYARTRHFYARCGFEPAGETDEWGLDNPCLLLEKPLVTA